jgi:hypothetical protein
MIRISRTLPGELEGDINPEDYGFEVIKEDPPDDSEAARRVAQLYAQIQERTGMVIPPIEKYLEDAAETTEPLPGVDGPETDNGDQQP